MTITLRLVNSAFLLVCATAGMAQDLAVPAGAVMTRDLVQDPGAFALPVGPWSREAGLPVERIEGRVNVQAFRIDGSDLTPLQVILPLRDQLAQQGFASVLDCTAQDCGGFDFRFAAFVLPAPQMAVDLTNYHVLSMQDDSGSAVSVIASRTGTAAYLQIVRAGARPGTTTGAAPRGNAPAPSAPAGSLAEMLDTAGHAILPGLVYSTGSASLGDGRIDSLDALANYLGARPDARVVLVGHTDATGSLDGNVSLSRKRAQAAVDYLVARHEIDASRISAQGAGYLAPVASNLTDAGRDRNRRVEAVLLP